MQIDERSEGELLELLLSGSFDNEASWHFRDAIDDHVRDGWHQILVQMQGVDYISSAGISALIAAKNRMEQLNGLFGICHLTPAVERVLSETRLLESLVVDPDHARRRYAAGEYTRSLNVRVDRADGLDLEVYSFDGDHSLRCTLLGNPSPIFDSAFSPSDCLEMEFSDQSLAIGLGAIGEEVTRAQDRFGEFLSIAGSLAQSSPSRHGMPDYSVPRGDFVPRIQVAYGMHCEGTFSKLIRFDPVEPGDQIELSTVVSQCMHQAKCEVAGVVVLAECGGLVGAHLKKSPVVENVTTVDRFQFPEIRNWMSFSPERVYARNLALIVGVARRASADLAATELGTMLRPIDVNEQLHGHFHSAVFPYRPLKKRTLDLQASVRALLESGAIRDVLHLLRDDRTIVGAGESELLAGACWISPITTVDVKGTSS